jgi:hypothetical protein
MDGSSGLDLALDMTDVQNPDREGRLASTTLRLRRVSLTRSSLELPQMEMHWVSIHPSIRASTLRRLKTWHHAYHHHHCRRRRRDPLSPSDLSHAAIARSVASGRPYRTNAGSYRAWESVSHTIREEELQEGGRRNCKKERRAYMSHSIVATASGAATFQKNLMELLAGATLCQRCKSSEQLTHHCFPALL